MKLTQFMQMLRRIVGKDAVKPTRKRYKSITNKVGRRRLTKFHQPTHLHSFGTWRALKPFNH